MLLKSQFLLVVLGLFSFSGIAIASQMKDMPEISFLVQSKEAFALLDPSYTVSYGDPEAPSQVVEFFSFSCPQCLKLFQIEFSLIRREFVDSGRVYWVYHPDPADLITLQAMECFRSLSNAEKQLFLQKMAVSLPQQNSAKACSLMQEFMKKLGKTIPELGSLVYLENTETFQAAYRYLKQSSVPTELPTIQLNGKLYGDLPTYKFIKSLLGSL